MQPRGGSGRGAPETREPGTGRVAVSQAQECGVAWEELDREELERFGKVLDRCPASLGGRTVGIVLAERLLRVRTREGNTTPLKANAAQRAFEARRGERNIVLKARQMGLLSLIHIS